MAVTVTTARPYILYREITNDPANCVANTCIALSLTVGGSLPTHSIEAWCKTLTSGLILGKAFCSTAGTVVVPMCNVTSADINQASSTFSVLIR